MTATGAGQARGRGEGSRGSFERGSADRGAVMPAHGILLANGRPVEDEKICGYYMNRQTCKFGEKCDSFQSHGMTVKEAKFPGSTTREDRVQR